MVNFSHPLVIELLFSKTLPNILNPKPFAPDPCRIEIIFSHF